MTKEQIKKTSQLSIQHRQKKKIESDDSSESDETIRPSTREHHYNDGDGENSWGKASTDDDQSFTQQDDENTVALNETSAIKKKDQNKIVLPNFIRYQMMIQLDQEGNENLIEESKRMMRNHQ